MYYRPCTQSSGCCWHAKNARHLQPGSPAQAKVIKDPEHTGQSLKAKQGNHIAGNRETRLSPSGLDIKKRRCRITGIGPSRDKWQPPDLCPLRQKETLEDLNNRLAAYLEKVSLLEESNRHFERKIQDLCEKRANVSHDTSQYKKVIAEMETQINKLKMKNAELSLEVDNTKLTADNFKSKYKTELSLLQFITADIKEVKTTGSHLQMETDCLKVELQMLNEELSCLKKDHQEDIVKLQEDQSKCQVKVEVNSQPANDLTKALEEMREHYKVIVWSSNKKTEPWLVSKFRQCNYQNTMALEPLQTQKREVTLLRRTTQNLEAELENLHNLKASRMATLTETEQNYAAQLQRMQNIISRREDELAKTRAEFKQMSADGGILHYLKDLLEMEIKTYGQLMDAEEIRMDTSNGPLRTSTSKQMYMFLISEAMSITCKSLFIS
ncbi:keratin, type I cytoskeletal 19-like isoform X2 [Xenopus laevis]|uniref:Keratin, type I cytoskeletal 19-like isoform X2 n=2 Tax=Xenopus laevis TaxID=8355 RepID=A0A8J1LV66_XENLA|nr:keratin, type I cytoskeletal 19-like isoform X2 [Xenopus laevis]